MDSLTQFALGAACAATVAPRVERRRALLVGGLLGTVPDLDVLPLWFIDDPVKFLTWHRTLTHSLFVLPLVAVSFWGLALRRWRWEGPDRWRWLAAMQLALLTHPLLDAHTVYGTQLLWPLSSPPVMWSTVFIIDPLYTVPLLGAVVLARHWGERVAAQRVLIAGLLLSSAYLGWSWVAKHRVESALRPMLARIGLDQAPLLTVPTPFNSLGWRVVVMQPDGYFEGLASALYPERPIRLRFHARDPEFAKRFGNLDSVRRMRWFTHGFMAIERRATSAVLTDLRMGMEPDYMFRFVVARNVLGRWMTVHPPERLPRPRLDRGAWVRLRDSILQAFDARHPATIGEVSPELGPEIQTVRSRDESANRSR